MLPRWLWYNPNGGQWGAARRRRRIALACARIKFIHEAVCQSDEVWVLVVLQFLVCLDRASCLRYIATGRAGYIDRLLRATTSRCEDAVLRHCSISSFHFATSLKNIVCRPMSCIWLITWLFCAKCVCHRLKTTHGSSFRYSTFWRYKSRWANVLRLLPPSTHSTCDCWLDHKQRFKWPGSFQWIVFESEAIIWLPLYFQIAWNKSLNFYHSFWGCPNQIRHSSQLQSSFGVCESWWQS